MHKNVLITGGSGLLGTRLTSLLMQKGYQVSHLSRSTGQGLLSTYQWNVNEGSIDSAALEDADFIIHLAGAGIADKRWSAKRKKEILESRTKSSALLYKALKETPNRVKAIVSASAIGYYGNGGPDETFEEKSGPGNDFLSGVVGQWENSVDQITSLGTRVVKLRIGILLSDMGGALPSIAMPIKWGVGSPLGSGQQIISWIHIDDVCNMFIKGIEDLSMQGAYNAVSPHPTTNEDLTRQIAKVLRKPLWVPHVPAFALKLILGEMAGLVLGGSKVSSIKIQNTGFEFLYTDLDKALRNLLQK